MKFAHGDGGAVRNDRKPGPSARYFVPIRKETSQRKEKPRLKESRQNPPVFTRALAASSTTGHFIFKVPS